MQIPVSYCQTCKEKLPVVLREVSLEIEELNGAKLEVIFCPQCGDILNFQGDVKVEWYDVSEVHKVTNFKFAPEND
jgi:hypothetical protein